MERYPSASSQQGVELQLFTRSTSTDASTNALHSASPRNDRVTTVRDSSAHQNGDTPRDEVPTDSAATTVRQDRHHCQLDFTLVPSIFKNAQDEPLNWRPLLLRPNFLWTNTIICSAIAGSVAALLYGIGSERKVLLTSANAYFFSTYAPTAIAAVSVTILRSTLFELARVLPFMRMADQDERITDGASSVRSVGGAYFPFPFIHHSDDRILKISMQILLFLFANLTAAKAVLLESQPTSQGQWTLTVHVEPAYALVAAYALMSLFYFIILCHFWKRNTGLRWDPASPLDHLALVYNTNAMVGISALPLNQKRTDHLLAKSQNWRWRIGYWERFNCCDRTQSRIYGIGVLNAAESGRSVAVSTGEERAPDIQCSPDIVCSCSTGKRCRLVSRVYPYISHPLWMAFFMIILAGLVAALIIGATRGALRGGASVTAWWLSPSSTASSWTIIIDGQKVAPADSINANLMFRAVPILVASYYSNAVVANLSKRLCDTQCWSSLAAGPLTSTESLATSYSTKLSFLVPLDACRGGHYRLAAASFVAVVAPYLPVFVSGLCVFHRTGPNTIVITFAKPAFVIVCLYMFMFIVQWALAWPLPRELLLRSTLSIADRIRPFLHSSMLQDEALKVAAAETTQANFYARVLLANHRYQLGENKGICGRRHLGVDIVKKGNGEDKPLLMSAKELLTLKPKHKMGGVMHRALDVEAAAVPGFGRFDQLNV